MSTSLSLCAIFNTTTIYILMQKTLPKLFTDTKLLSMLFLGMSCGIPLALILSVLKTWLAEFDITMTKVAAFAFISTPYIFKFVWAPFMDGLKIPVLHNSLGHRRSWLIITQILLMISIFFLGDSNPGEDLLHCAIVATLVAFFSASQDIVVDAYRIERYQKEMQAMCTTIYVYGYRIGLYMSGAGMLMLASKFGWTYAYYTAAVVMSIGVITTMLSSEPNHTHKKENKFHSYAERISNIVINPFRDFISVKNWYYVLLFVALFKLGDALAGNLTMTFLKKTGFTLEELALYVKTYGLVATLVGLLIGGIMAHRFNLFKCLIFAGILQMVSNLMFVYQDYVGHNVYVLAQTIVFENLSASIGDVVFIAYLSRMCSFTFAATQYALLSACASFARTFIAGVSGYVVDSYGWSTFFVVTTIAAIPGILMIFKINSINRDQES